MKTGHVVTLTGGGQGALLALRRHFRSALADAGSPRPLVAYVGTASNDSGAFFTMIRGGLALGGGARMKMVKLASKRASASEARALLDECDLVFVSGGDVELGMKVLHDKDMVTHLRALARAGKPMFGVSAGSIMLAREWVRFPGDDDARAEVFGCLDIAPVHVDAHDEADDWKELQVLVRLLHARGDAKPLGLGLTRKGALRIEVGIDDRTTVSALGTPAPRFGIRHGKVASEAPLHVT